mmetsp:Transcript_38156/g.74717  ORF Transcript_38156/g.74717 Transcript_38156/m.74717 type:complete len:266 (+) Transcript_38156:440-1237(+)
MKLCQILRLVHGRLALVQILERGLLIPLVLKPSLHQRSQLRILHRRVQNRRGAQPQIHIRQRGLPQDTRGRRKIQNIVLDLVREPQMKPKLLHGRGGGGPVRVSPQERGGAARVTDQGGRLVIGLAEVRLHFEEGLGGRFELHDLPRDQGLEGGGHNLDHRGVFETGEEDGGAGEEVVAGEDRHFVGVEFMDGLATPAGVGFVEDVVVDEGGDVDHLDDLSELGLTAPRFRALVVGGGDGHVGGAGGFPAPLDAFGGTRGTRLRH